LVNNDVRFLRQF